MEVIRLKDKEFKLFIPEKDIRAAIGRMAGEIRRDAEHTNPLFVGILNGAFMFIADLMHCLNGPYELTFARYASYSGTRTGGVIHEIMPVRTPVEGRHLILLEDIIDTGHTMHYLTGKLKKEGALEVKLATLLFKPDALQYSDVAPDYVGLSIPNDFIVGYGLDYDGLGRAYGDIYKLVTNE
ncbi:MAG: hypoxanthine phosphoribosyltransferase [Tannerellaceae bacterium]|jgi:hypoxanthine phosphoribosyltransferase|nr:hypoxanthine phosphoribosyltransferase [Tannerellaceae bacterium]